MATNIFTKIPKRGDIVVKDLTTKTPQYIVQETFVKADLNTNVYEIVGVVYWTNGKEVGVVYKENASNAYCNRGWWYLTGYTLDGTSRTGIISIRVAADSYAANVDKTIAYTASDIEGMVAELNKAFLADAQFVEQDWYADVVDGKVRVHCDVKAYQQFSSNTGKGGFSLGTCMPEITYKADMRRKHGGKGGEGAISSWHRALAYFRNDTTTTNYNPNADVTSIKRSYPICLPGYLGTSKNQSDHCAFLRSVYGEGEEGWIRFMRSCLPVVPTDYGNMGMHNGKERTQTLASFEFTSNKVAVPTPMCKAASYCAGKQSQTVEKGEFWLPTMEELSRIIKDVEYGTNSSRNADVLNKGLNLIGGNAVSNGSNWWSCLRCYTNGAWCSIGNGGFFNGNNMYNSYGCVPVSLYKIS